MFPLKSPGEKCSLLLLASGVWAVLAVPWLMDAPPCHKSIFSLCLHLTFPLCLSGLCPHFSLNNSSPATDHLNRVLTSSLGPEGSSGHPLVDQKLAQFMNRHLSKNCEQESLSTRLSLTGALASLLGVGFHLGYKDHQFFHPTVLCLYVCQDLFVPSLCPQAVWMISVSLIYYSLSN